MTEVELDTLEGSGKRPTSVVLARCRCLPFRKRSMLFLTIDAILGSIAFRSGR